MHASLRVTVLQLACLGLFWHGDAAQADYRAPQFAASIHVYDAGNPGIPDGTANIVVSNNLDPLNRVAMTGYRRYFIMIGVTAPASSGAEGGRQMEAFVQSVARILAAAGAR